jgi:hypothetical protein
MNRSLLFSFCLVVATPSCQINRLHHFHVKEPIGEVTATTALGEERLPLRFPSPSSVRYPELKTGEILINEIRGGESAAEFFQTSQTMPKSSINAVAAIIGDEIAHEFGLGSPPGFAITLMHYAPGERVLLSGTVPVAQGIFAGIPLENGRVTADTLGILTTALAHEYSELLLACPDTLHCSLYANDQTNRWAGEGVAELMTSLCELRIREAGFDINPIESVAAPITISSAAASSTLRWSWQSFGRCEPTLGAPTSLPTTINLSRWSFREEQNPTLEGGLSEQGLRYLAAEYVVSLWYRGAQSQGMERPIAELAKWIGYCSPGPSYQSLIQWMEASSGVSLANLVQAVPKDCVLEYHQNKLGALCETQRGNPPH